ncbi:MAG: U32 family peptidase [Rhodocyclaceae bacterium]
MKLSLAPLPYYWPREATLAFYREVEAMPFDIVYLGETVCSRRHELRASDWIAIAQAIAASGKEAVLSSQALIESESDLKALRRLVDEGGFLIEANEMGAVRLLAERGLPFVAGASLNVYNEHTLALLARLGALRWVAPHEMNRGMLEPLLAAAPSGIQTELFACGRIPLAWSARCFTARHFNLQKDACEFRCMEFADGLQVKTREGDDFLVLNGIQTQSHRVYDLLPDLKGLCEAGVGIARIAPQSQGTGELAALFRAAIDGGLTPAEAGRRLTAHLPAPACNGFWHGRPGLELVSPGEPG